jgi:hypothetical protein
MGDRRGLVESLGFCGCALFAHGQPRLPDGINHRNSRAEALLVEQVRVVGTAKSGQLARTGLGQSI